MSVDLKPELQFQQVALDKSINAQSRTQEITVHEGRHNIDGFENIKFSRAGGGFSFHHQNITRNIVWQTQENTLLLSEYCLDADLVSNQVKICFKNSVVLPYVSITNISNHVVITFCTVHAAHSISVNLEKYGVPMIHSLDRPIVSILKEVLNFDFNDAFTNHYYSESLQGYACSFTADANYVPLSQSIITTCAINMHSQSIVLIKMSTTESPTQTSLTQSSRISRLWSGINPWAGGGISDSISDLGLLNISSETLCLITVCRDNKLRLWSCQTQTAFHPVDISQYLQNIDVNEDMQIEQHIRVCQKTGRFVVYIGTTEQNVFLQFGITCEEKSEIPMVNYLSSIALENYQQGGGAKQLVDYTVSENNIIRVLRRDSEDQSEMYVCDADIGVWHPVAMQQMPANEPNLDIELPINEAYMDYVFTPGRFCMEAIFKALTIPKRRLVTSGRNINWNSLKENVLEHIESIIMESYADEDDQNEEMQKEIEAQMEILWNDFYQSCLQYHHSLSQPLGLTKNFSLESKLESFTFIVQKSGLSVLTPVSALEAVCRKSHPSIFKGIIEDEYATSANFEDITALLTCLGVLSDMLGPDLLDILQHSIQNHDAPSLQLEDMDPTIDEVLKIDSEERSYLDDILANMKDIPRSIEMLLILLEPTLFGVKITDADSLLQLSGSCGIELLTRCIQLHIHNRLQLVLLLYVLTALLNNSERGFVESSGIANYQGQVMKHVRVYIALKWISLAEVHQLPPSTLESTLQTLSMQEHSTTIPQSRYSHLQARSITILEFFISLEGSRLLHKFYKSRQNQRNVEVPECLFNRVHTMEVTTDVLPAAVNFFLYIMWPQEIGESFNDTLGHGLAMHDFMLTSGQWKGLMTYLQEKLSPWCLWCSASRQYMLAHCFLYNEQYNEAMESFIAAASGVAQEEYLATKFLPEDDNYSSNELEIIYFTKILPIFKKFGLSNSVIQLAEHAITCADQEDPSLPSLWLSIFHENLELGKYDQAHRAIISNPNLEHRKDCLRAFVVDLCERKQYNTLVEFPFDNMQDELVNILLQRARCSDLALATHPYYDTLYCFHVFRGNYRKAAIAMYEQCWRLGCEFSQALGYSTNLNILQKQHTCILACINCLHLVAEGNRWIMHPGSGRGNKPVMSPKHDYDGNEIDSTNENVAIKELEDIQKECMVIEMRIKIEIYSKQNKDVNSASSMTTPNEIATILCHLGLYDDAILILRKFNMSLVSVFESLSQRCVKVAFMDDDGKSNAWRWIQENNLLGDQSNGNLTQWSAVDGAFRLLQIYIETYGDAEMRGSSYYKAVAMGLLGLSSDLPTWFINLYKKKNCPELLRLLVCFDRLEDATHLLLDYIDAAMGTDSEKFGVKHPINNYISTRQPTWLPYTVIDQLHYILNSQRTQNNYDEVNRDTRSICGCSSHSISQILPLKFETKLYHKVDNKMNEYFTACDRISLDMVSIAQDGILMHS